MSSTGDVDVSLIRGGPFYRAQQATHLITPNKWNLGRRTLMAIAIGWLPVVLLTLAANPGAVGALITDYGVNARMLVAVPVLLAGQLLMDDRFRDIVGHIRDAALLSPTAETQFERSLRRVRRIRDSSIPELVIVVVAFARIATLAGLRSNPGFAQSWALDGSGPDAHLSGAGWYYLVVSQLLYQFLILINLWKWLLWTYFLFRLSRLPLQLVPTHPDRHGGLGFLEMSPIAIAPTLFAASTAIGATWRAQMLREGVQLASLKLDGAAFVCLGFIIALGPLIVFTPTLTRLRRQAILDYGTLGQIHSTEFHKKWIVDRANQKEDFLAAPEVSTLTDYATSYELIWEVRPVPVHRGVLIGLALAIMIPLVPVVVAEIPLATVLKNIFNGLS